MFCWCHCFVSRLGLPEYLGPVTEWKGSERCLSFPVFLGSLAMCAAGAPGPWRVRICQVLAGVGRGHLCSFAKVFYSQHTVSH